LASQAIEEHKDSTAGVLVEIAGGLIRKDQAGIMNQGTRDGNALLFASGQAIGKGISSISEPYGSQKILRTSGCLNATDPVEFQGQHNVLLDGEGREQIEELEYEANLIAAIESALPLVEAGEVLAVQPDRSSIGAIDAAYQIEEGALATAAFAHDGHGLAPRECGIQVS
jgi:hypothetical protein